MRYDTNLTIVKSGIILSTRDGFATDYYGCELRLEILPSYAQLQPARVAATPKTTLASQDS